MLDKIMWVDAQYIGELLAETYPELDPLAIGFVQLRTLVCDLPNFADHPDKCNERILEAIQMVWLDESA